MQKFCEMQIGYCMQSIILKWWYFQWLWLTTVTTNYPYFYVLGLPSYVWNGWSQWIRTSQGHVTYFEILICNHILWIWHADWTWQVLLHAWYTIHEGDVFSHVATLNLGKQLIWNIKAWPQYLKLDQIWHVASLYHLDSHKKVFAEGSCDATKHDGWWMWNCQFEIYHFCFTTVLVIEQVRDTQTVFSAPNICKWNSW